MTTATRAYEAYLDFLESEGIKYSQDERARAVLRAMYDHIRHARPKTLEDVRREKQEQSKAVFIQTSHEKIDRSR